MRTTIAAQGDLPASADLSASQWSAKLAALVGRGAADDDPRVIGCRAALAFHRVRRVIDAERGHLDPADADALQEALTMS
ncbi:MULTISPECIES: hypothetical protein [unclassified Gordonia (in: high G+C Gram-positive bacteria)]|uniref:hypothetical protein n=1 Tax=unclassified Gordonia (in: high G+C Gram-positive bacteria) TaxID=2657482 RepID=UPI00071C5C18|nr:MULTISPECIES: hypothetical protein [unclassified Gordonia (in: high G+C Gram-positive bacteria)]KSU60785.1 hypothetical protein AS181_03195 [Gordonia sp. SGD-V-85]SCB86723.1 hypothetical protein GA0061091_102230 [Gordonia sp. v-85]